MIESKPRPLVNCSAYVNPKKKKKRQNSTPFLDVISAVKVTCQLNTWFEKEHISVIQSLEIIFCWYSVMVVTEAAILVSVSIRKVIEQFKKIRKFCLSILKTNST